MNSTYGNSNRYEGVRGASYYAWQNDAQELQGRLNLWKFQPWLHADDSVMDFGCGSGWLLRHLNVRNKIGVEINETARAGCVQNGIEVYSEIAQIPGGTVFDKIISHHCLEHVPYPIAALRELHARLKEEGLLILVLPIDDWRIEGDFTGNDIDHHLHTWTPRLVSNSLQEAGFKCIRAEILTHALPMKWKQLHRFLPEAAFQWSCRAWGFLRKRRQLHVLASKSA